MLLGESGAKFGQGCLDTGNAGSKETNRLWILEENGTGGVS
jgi:hypothetical protein